MSRGGRSFQDDVHGVMVNIIANAIWFLLAILATTAVVFLTRSSEGSGLSATLTMPTWLVALVILIIVGTAVFVFITNRRASVVHGRNNATKTNLELLASRRNVDQNSRVVRSTRFGLWAPKEDLAQRDGFREELDKAILREHCDVRRIWNVSSLADVQRIREMLTKYAGNENHSIRAYLGMPYHVLPELLIVDQRGASISFASTRTPNRLDWAIHVKRPDLTQVIKDYFDVLWEKADKILDSGEITASGTAALAEFEKKITGVNDH